MTTLLRDELAQLINLSHQNTWTTFDWVREHPRLYNLAAKKVARWITPGEPAFVSNLLEYPANQDFLSGIVSRHLQLLGMSKVAPIVSGVFIHQKPMVQFQGYRGYVELGDLLLVRQHFQSGIASPQGRAFLLQAKTSDNPDTGPLHDKEAQQFALYSDWAKPFIFPRKEFASPPDGSTHWNFKNGPLPHSTSGVYGIVANGRSTPSSFPEQCPWAIGFATVPKIGSPPSVNAGGLSLAEALEGFLIGSWGRPWEALPSAKDHWSSFIHQCLAAATQWRGYPIQRIGATSRSRLRDVMGLAVLMAGNPDYFGGALSPAGLDRVVNAFENFSQWNLTLKNVDEGQGDGHDLPPTIDSDLRRPSGGISTLYIATYGDEPLRQVDQMLG